ncbi:sensor histidine kinase [Rhodopirellula halodulae]|uniref:sensor histidine kinase n=1 Tax=Rhodopirellula halodulae TaxID=2894198 RepID=UPI001E60E81E|nr:ATP-binding protein [Rhodopirellula sp. JC737]MCC9655215.1 sensor histidine kinase [Rhodopirellula sp. JC737]
MPLIAPAPLGSSTWLLQLRTFAIVGQLFTILFARLLTPTLLPLGALLALVVFTAITNGAYGWWLARTERRRQSEPQSTREYESLSGHGSLVEKRTVGISPDGSSVADSDATVQLETPLQLAFVLMAMDLITLTAMLYLTGGADNPFSLFYFVNIAVGGVILTAPLTWTLTGLAILGFVVLLVDSRPVAGLTITPQQSPDWMIANLDLRDCGMLLAFVTCATVLTYFVTRISRQLRLRERDLRRSQSERADAMRLEGLTTLAAGAAHELASPLSAIDVACRELTRHLEAIPKPKSVDEDLSLIDGQLQMCRQILSRMRAASGDTAAQRWNRTTLGDLIDTALEGIRDPHRVEIVETPNDDSWEDQPLWLPEEAVAQAIRNLIHNGLDASESSQSVAVEPIVDHDAVRLQVRDQGLGMSGEVMDRAGDPFFTTKEPGRGIGLGLFLTRNVITRLGGSLTFDSTPGVGTVATVRLPLPKDGSSV